MEYTPLRVKGSSSLLTGRAFMVARRDQGYTHHCHTAISLPFRQTLPFLSGRHDSTRCNNIASQRLHSPSPPPGQASFSIHLMTLLAFTLILLAASYSAGLLGSLTGLGGGVVHHPRVDPRFRCRLSLCHRSRPCRFHRHLFRLRFGLCRRRASPTCASVCS